MPLGEEYGAMACHQFYNLSHSNTLNYSSHETKINQPVAWYSFPLFYYLQVVDFATMVIRQIETTAIKVRANLS